MNSDRRFINYHLLFLAYFSLFIFGMIDNARGPAFPRIMEFLALSPDKASWMFTFSSIAALVAGLLSRYWMKRLGPELALACFFAFMGFGSAMIAWSVSQGQWGTSLLFIGSVLFGFGGGGSGISMNILVGRAVSAHYMQKAYGALHTLYGVSSFCAPLFINIFVLMGYDWKLLFYLSAVVCFGASMLTSKKYWTRSTRSGLESQQESRPESSGKKIWHYMLAVTMGIYVAGEVLISSRLVIYLEEALSMDKIAATSTLSYFFAALLTGRFLTIVSPIRLNSILWPVGLQLLAMVAFLCGIFGAPIWLALTGLFMGPVFPLTMSWTKKIFINESEKVIALIMNAVSLAIIGMHFFVGEVSGRYGIKLTFNYGPWLFFVSAVMLMIIGKQIEKRYQLPE